MGTASFHDYIECVHVVIDEDNPYYYCDEYGVIYLKNGLPPYYALNYGPNLDFEMYEDYGSICYQATGSIDKCVITDGVEAIFPYAFIFSAVKEITIPKSVTYIDDSFGDYNSEEIYKYWRIENVNYCGTEKEWNEIVLKSNKEGIASCFENATFHFNAESPTEKIYKVDFISNIDYESEYQNIKSEYVRMGSSITLPTPEKGGYYCFGWIDDDKKETYNCGEQFTPTRNTTLTAVYKAYGAWGDGPKSYKVTYEADGGTVSETEVYSSNGGVILPTPIRAGYRCLGWLDENDGRIYECGFELGVEENITLYAVWKKEDNHRTYIKIKKEINLNCKDTEQIVPEILTDANTYIVYYSSSDPSVAVVDMYGNITAMDRGSTEITCMVSDEYGNVAKETCTVNVNFSFGQWLIWIFMLGFLWYL